MIDIDYDSYQRRHERGSDQKEVVKLEMITVTVLVGPGQSWFYFCCLCVIVINMCFSSQKYSSFNDTLYGHL